jgi:hypothetical protein
MRALLAVLILAALTAQDDARLRGLLDRLAADEIDVRERAAADLVDYGKDALPALRRLQASSGDVELQARVASVLKGIAENEILGLHWRRGALVTIDSEGAPVAAVLEDLERQGRDRFKYDPADLQDPVVLHLKEVPFWEAVDELCRVAPALTWEGDGDALVFTRRARLPYPTRRQGEFSVWIDAITFTRDYDFTGNPRSTFTMTLASSWESGIVPVAVDQRVTEILDEDGNNLLQPDRYTSYGARLDSPKGRVKRGVLYVPLQPGAKPVKEFRRVKGTASFYFPRSYDDISIDLKSSLQPVQRDRTVISVRNFRPQKDACAFELILTSTLVPGDPLLDRLPYEEIAVVDDQGGLHRPPSSSRSQSYSGTSFTIHENLQVPLPEGRTPVGLKLRVLKDVLEKRVPFEFEDIPVE